MSPTALRGFGPLGLAAILVILAGNFLFAPLSAVLVLLWAYAAQTPWHELGFVRPKSWTRGIVIAHYHFLTGNTAALPGMIPTLIVVAGFGEETVYRGYMFERLGKLLGSSRRAKIAIVLITTSLFAAAHYPDQGIPGVEQAVFTGLVFGGIFAVTGELFMLMVAHATFDLVALALIYWNVEAKVILWP